MTNGKIISGLSFDEYSNIEAVNFSTLKLMSVSPLHYRDAVENGGVRRPAFALGSAAHTAILEPREWMRRYAIVPQDIPRRDMRIKAYAAFVEESEAAGKQILSEKEYTAAVDVAESVKLNRGAADLLRGKTLRELTIKWEHKATGLQLRSRLDLAKPSVACVDVKTSNTLVPRDFFRSATQYGYPEQCAFYADAYTAATGEVLPFKILAVESKRPHDVVIFNVPEDVLEYGRKNYERWLENVARCRDSNQWPGIGGETGELNFELPPWASPEQDDEIIAA